MAGPKSRKRAHQLAGLRTALNEGRFVDAWADAQRLIALRVKDVQLLNLGGIAAFQTGNTEAAIDLLSQAAARRSSDPEILMNLANVQAAMGDGEAALISYQIAHDAGKHFAEPAYNAAVMLKNRGDHRAAVEWFGRALSRDPEHIQAAIGKAEALNQLGDFDEASATLSLLLAHDPNNAAAYINLSALAMETGDAESAYKHATKATECDPGSAVAHYNLGVAAQAKDNFEDAISHYRRSLALDADNAAAALNLGEAHLKMADVASARIAFERAQSIDPSFAKAMVNLGDLDLRENNPTAALDRVQRFLDVRPGHPSALAFKAIALRDLGDVDAARELDDMDRFILPHTIPVPSGFDDIKAYNVALADHLMAHPTLASAPTSHATRKGLHSGELLTAPRGPFDAFQDIIVEAFHRYRRQFAGEVSHPFLDMCPDEYDISVWGVVMYEAGHQVSHIHPAAWLSGVYYVEVPPAISDSELEHAGWIEFGHPPDDIHAQHAPDVKLFQPEAGSMLLFPSHFYHRTLPLTGEQRRISVAFDIMASA